MDVTDLLKIRSIRMQNIPPTTAGRKNRIWYANINNDNLKIVKH